MQILSGFHHALILSPTIYARLTYPDPIDSQSIYWKHEDDARQLANQMMAKYPNLSIACPPTTNRHLLIKPEIWQDPIRLSACLFSQTSRIILFVPSDGLEQINLFAKQCLQPLLNQIYEWHSRFLIVVIGNVPIPNELDNDRPIPFIKVIRFRQVGWFRDVMAMILLERAIKRKYMCVCVCVCFNNLKIIIIFLLCVITRLN